jgi:DnaJ-class molecular chaperone
MHPINNPPPGTYHTTPCPQCKGEPMRWSHEMLADRVKTRVTLCPVCGGSGIAVYRVTKTTPC